jgi:hypothetical protein
MNKRVTANQAEKEEKDGKKSKNPSNKAEEGEQSLDEVHAKVAQPHGEGGRKRHVSTIQVMSRIEYPIINGRKIQ